MRLWIGEAGEILGLIKADAEKEPQGPWGIWNQPGFTKDIVTSQARLEALRTESPFWLGHHGPGERGQVGQAGVEGRGRLD